VPSRQSQKSPQGGSFLKGGAQSGSLGKSVGSKLRGTRNEHRRVKSVFNAVRAFLTTSILYQNLFKITRYKAVFSVFKEIFFLFFTTGSSLSKTLLPESVYYKKRTAAAVLFYRV
jgi:hypothetical protein